MVPTSMTISVRNVNRALAEAVDILTDPVVAPFFDRVAPRGAETIEWPAPVLTAYEKPLERVLFSSARDANPFFHLFEALWMLRGRDDVAFVERLVKRMRDFSDDGESFHGAYGFRWRAHFGQDQIEEIVKLLQDDPSTRRAVLTMWSPADDLGNAKSKDLPCNTQVYFKVRNNVLRTTVTCRSNDILWGAYGANAVHFSILHEYIARRVGVAPGPMYQLSDSWHLYLQGPARDLWEKLLKTPRAELYHDPYASGEVKPLPMRVHAAWESDLRRFFALVDQDPHLVSGADFESTWWRSVAAPMWLAWLKRDSGYLEMCAASDWQRAGLEWLARRR